MRRRMPAARRPPHRHKSAAQHPHHRWRAWALFFVLLAWAGLALCWGIEDRFDPILDELAEYEGRAAVVRAMNAAVAAELAARPGFCDGLYTLQYAADGTVQTVRADAAAMAAARTALLTAVETALAALPPVERMVPFGTLTGFSLLNGLGPGWPLSLQPEGYAEGEIVERTETTAIDRTRYSAVLEITVTVNMVLDGKNRVLQISNTVPLASVLVSGEVPLYYAGG